MDQVESTRKPGRTRRARTLEEREHQMIALAVDLAEEQLRNGTASAQVITHYLKLGSTKDRLEKELLAEKKEMMKAKTEMLQSTKRIEALYGEAIKAMRVYSGNNHEED